MKKTVMKNGKERTITIPDSEIQRSMKAYDLTKDEAIQMWLEDNEYLVNEEQEKLIKETKGQGKVYATTGKERKKRTVVKKVDEDKQTLIKFLNDLLLQRVEDLTIVNDQKLLEFNYNGNHYKLDLIKQRKRKE